MKKCIKMLDSHYLIAFYVDKDSLGGVYFSAQDSYNICMGCIHKRFFSIAYLSR